MKEEFKKLVKVESYAIEGKPVVAHGQLGIYSLYKHFHYAEGLEGYDDNFTIYVVHGEVTVGIIRTTAYTDGGFNQVIKATSHSLRLIRTPRYYIGDSGREVFFVSNNGDYGLFEYCFQVPGTEFCDVHRFIVDTENNIVGSLHGEIYGKRALMDDALERMTRAGAFG